MSGSVHAAVTNSNSCVGSIGWRTVLQECSGCKPSVMAFRMKCHLFFPVNKFPVPCNHPNL
jgi:hypothetical protein